jgi:hypothetical protein
MNRAVTLAIPLSTTVVSLAAAPLVALAVPMPRPHQTTVDAAVILADGGGDPCVAARGSQPLKYPLCAAD